MTIDKLQEQKNSLVEQQKQAEVNFHQIAGAIALVDQQIKELEEPKKKDKK
tara:strand:- start:4385 stop:4537 length:153 start_codon:yes stop_codon:yes gene_type:complete